MTVPVVDWALVDEAVVLAGEQAEDHRHADQVEADDDPEDPGERSHFTHRSLVSWTG